MDEITMESLREKYPNPVAHPEKYPGGTVYCIGWALCREVKQAAIFGEIDPEGGDLSVAGALRMVNPKLSQNDALDFTEAIIDLNDEEKFDRAWGILEKALNYG